MSFYDTEEGQRVLDLENQITTLSANIYAAEYQWLCLLAQFDELEGWCGKGIKSFAHWLNWKCGISLVAGREKVRVARKLGLLPLISKAMSEGRLSYSKVRAITRIATAENEQDLLYIAENGTAEHLEKTVRLFRRAKAAIDSDVDSSQANQQNDMKYLTYYYDTDGSLVLDTGLGELQSEEQIPIEVGGVDYVYDDGGIIDQVGRDSLLLRMVTQTIRAGGVDERVASPTAGQSLHGSAGEVGDFRVSATEMREESRLADVWIAREDDESEPLTKRRLHDPSSLVMSL